jgi:hypothetical protein
MYFHLLKYLKIIVFFFDYNKKLFLNDFKFYKKNLFFF